MKNGTRTSGPENAFMLGSAISLRLGRFARFAQAAHLLSQVLHQVADKSSDTTQLRRTIFSLVNVSRIEADMRQLEFCTQMAVYSGILLLDHPTLLPASHSRTDDLSNETSSILQSALKMSLYFSDAFVARVCDLISPFLLYLMYKVTSVCMRRSFGQGSESLDVRNAEAMRLSLKYLSRRWLAMFICRCWTGLMCC
ncbi:twinfilin-1 [Pochonia chlamydosporia 170]|uniref:Twinfilin-1 n=1 Tax=Pochonia chlamydosporia 170 TaxID=1380566 RepID=A0A179FXP3_METCM|nr:twinfilin-1 [Pochonia chlamydosporia 170]OAQ69871.1 twinfilin-1 [Pochonia chlamydosporia 170]